MINVKLGNKIFKDVDKIKVNTDDGSAVIFDEPPEKYDGEIFSEPGTVSDMIGLNIAYGDTPPEDTNKLWIKCDEPNSIEITSNQIFGNESIESNVAMFPVPIKDVCAVTVGTKIYCFGGYVEDVGMINSIYVFDTVTSKTEKLQITLSKSRYMISGLAIDKKIYLYSGRDQSANPVNIFEVFDTETETIRTIECSTCWYGRAIAAVGTKIYLFGGITSQSSNSKVISVYDTETGDYWDIDTSLKTYMSGISAATVGTKIYLFGGYNSSDEIYTDTISIFDPNTGKLEDISTLPTPCCITKAISIGTFIYLFGAYSYTSSKYNLFDKIFKFDTALNTIEELDSVYLPAPAYAQGIDISDQYIYLIGGCASQTFIYAENTIHKFIITMNLDTGKVLIATDVSKNLCNLVSTDSVNIQAGIKNVYLGNSKGYAEKVPALLCLTENVVEGEYPNSNCMESTAGTELTSSIECSVGDLVIAAIVTRDTLTISEGWTLVSTSEINSTDTYGQRLTWAYKFAENETESITVTQASEQRLYINMVALTGASNIIDNGYTYEDSKASAITATKPAGLTLWACSAPLWLTSLPYKQWEINNESYRIDLGTATQSRLAIFLDQSDSKEVTFTPGDTSSTIIIGSLTVEGMDRFYTETQYTRDVWTEI